MPVKHAFTSPKADGGDATLVRPSNWNADHVFQGLVEFPNQSLGFGVEPAALPVGVTDNWTFAGLADQTLIRVVTPSLASGQAILAGLEAQPVGTVRILMNHGDGSGQRASSDLLLRNRAASSLVANRIRVPDADSDVDLRIPYTGAAVLYYDAAAVGWIVIGLATGGRFERVTAGDLQLSQLSPAALAVGNNNDYAPSGKVQNAWWRLTPNAGAILTGIDATSLFLPSTGVNYGSIRILENAGATHFVITDEDAASSAGSRFSLPNGAVMVPPKATVIIGYDYTAARWRILAGESTFGKLTLYTRGDQLALGAAVNDWNPAGFSYTGRWRIASAAATSISGMVAQEDGAVRFLTAYDANCTLLHQSGLSAAANRFFLPGAANYNMPVGRVVMCVYDAAFGGWFIG